MYLLAIETTYLKPKMGMLWSRGLFHAICDPARLCKTAIGGTGENSISIFLNDQTQEGLQTFVKSFVIIAWFSLSIQVIMLLQQNSQRSGFTNSLANERSCVMACASLKV